MRTLGLIGGVTWHSTATYYARINERIADELGPYRSANLLMHSLDYGAVRDARSGGDWRPLMRLIVRAARGLSRAGADGIVLCSNSLHGATKQVESETGLPVIHIADALAVRALADGHTTLALFGTAFTMGQPFYRDRLRTHGLSVLTPEDPVSIDTIIMEELARGHVSDASRQVFVRALEPLKQAGADAMVLGCTEIGMLISQGDVSVPVLDTTLVHADAAVAWALG